MARRPSRQTVSVLAALAREPQAWRYGYELGKQVGLDAGTLYPILMRLCDRGLLEAAWESDPPLGRPRRHLYRIAEAGERAAAEAQAAARTEAAAVPVRTPRRRQRALGGT
jgi:DNA-binding PadR family transcriptional regulator